MSRIFRSLLLALCLLTLGLAAGPVHATASAAPFSFTPVKLVYEVTVVGAGATETEAYNNAIAALNASYRVLRTETGTSLCTEIELPAGPNQTPQTITLCSVEVHAWVLQKFIFLPH
jgi:hypothetical protein